MFAITVRDYDENEGNSVYATAYWTTRCAGTDNYSYDQKDATLFAYKSAARALIKTLSLDDEHEITEI